MPEIKLYTFDAGVVEQVFIVNKQTGKKEALDSECE